MNIRFSLAMFIKIIKKFVCENTIAITILAASLFIVYIPRISNYIFGGDTIEAMNGNLATNRINDGRIGGYLIEKILLLDKFNPQFITFVAVSLLFISAILWEGIISMCDNWGGGTLN